MRAAVGSMQEVREAWTEDQFTDALVNEAKGAGWLVYHPRPAQAKSGRYHTPTQGHTGFPDLVLVRRGRLIFAELKRCKTRTYRPKPEPEQEAWLAALEETGTRTVVWRPCMWDAICEELGA